MKKMIKDHSGSWMLSSGILTFNALAEYFKKTPGCNKSLCLSYGEQGMHSVYFGEDEVADSIRIGYEFIHNADECNAYENEVENLLRRMEQFIEKNLLFYEDEDNEALASLWNLSNKIRSEYLALYQFTSDSFVSSAYKEVDEFLSTQNIVIDKQEVLQCLSAVDTRGLYIFRENADWLSLVRRYLDKNKTLGEDFLQHLAEHARCYGFLMMGRSQFMCGADADYYLKKLQAYTEEDYRKEQARYEIQLESAVYTEERAKRCAEILKMPEDLYNVIRRIAKLAYLRLQMREVSQKLIVSREKNIMPQVYSRVKCFFDDSEFRFLLPAEIADIIQGKNAECFYQDLKIEVSRRRDAVCMELNNGEILVTSGEMAKKKFQSYLTTDATHASVYQGIPVYGKGTITGKVIHLDENATQPEKVDGCIVLCKSLIPNMLGACMKAFALITEEGGYSSHASVLCREMHISCIVGAHGVTNLRDGENIQIDFENGVIQRCAELPEVSGSKKLPCFISLKDVDDITQIGGKARQLRRIRERTPDAFLITAEGFSLLRTNPQVFVSQLKAHLNMLGTTSIILRSSFAEEDSQEKTFAGIFESYGNIDAQNIDQVLEITQTMIEAYHNVPDFYATEYDGLEDCSIIVQKMISPTISGVAISGYVYKGYEQILIEYVRGHLSVLMDSKVTPMRSFFRKADYYETTNSSRKWIPPFLVPSYSCLLDELVDQIIQLEAYYTGSIEVEWAMADERLYLLQVRKEPTR